MSIDGMDIVTRAIDLINKNKAEDEQLSKSPDTQLMGEDSNLDSLTIVNLFVAVEQIIEDDTGEIVIVVDQDAIGEDEHPFRTVKTLAAHLDERLK